MSEYMRPISTPLATSASVKPQSNTDVLDGDPGAQRRALAVFIGDFGGDLGLGRAVVERLDHRLVFLRDHAAPELPCARDLGVVGVEILGEQEEPPHARGPEQPLVAALDLGADEV